MQCPQCQHANPEGMKFCGECGAKLERLCPECGFSNPPTNKFCGECGHSLEIAQSPEPKFASPESYTPKYLAERILTSKASLEGERKQVTVLFADLKGSMELLADRDPEDARVLLDAVLNRMMEAVHRYEGTVNNLMGDGIMALFGAPLALEDHALRACYAALAIQNSMQTFAEEALTTHGVRVQTRVGLNSGEVVVRTIGNDLKMDYSAIGQTTHLAARMEQLANPGSIQLTADTIRLAEGFVQVEPVGPVPVKGMSEPVEVFELKGATSGRTRFQATAAGGLTRFVGRQNELDSLQSALDKAGEGHGQVFATLAEAGVGKSRLYWEFTRSHRTKDWTVIESGSVSHGKATAYRPVIDLLKEYFEVEDTDDHRRIQEKVTGKILTLDQSLTPVIQPVLSLLEVPVEDPSWENLDPSQRRHRTLDGVKMLLLREAKVQSLVVIFEDLHWIDSETQALLDSLIESLPGARVLLLVNYRPEYEHGWANKSYYTRLRLDPLSSEGAEELLAAILGKDEELAPLKTLLIERTEGNPFYLEESVQTLIESRTLAGGPGAYTLAEEVSRIQVPSTVQAILAARMDRLPPEEKRLLQTASVIGMHVPYPLLSDIAELGEEELNRGLSSLQRAEFLYETNLFPEREYTFKHALTHEVTYGSLIGDRKRALHTRLVEAIEAMYAGRIDEHVDRLAHHAYRGEEWEKACVYSKKAGAKAETQSAYRLAVMNYENAIVALEHLPESRKRVEQAIDLRLDLRNPLHALGEFARILDNLREAEALADALKDQRRAGWIFCYMTIYFARTGRPEEAIASGQRALTVAKECAEVSFQGLANYTAGAAYQRAGDYPRAIELFRRNVEFLKGDLMYERFGLAALPSVLSRTWLAWSLAECGEFDEGFAHAREAMRISEAVEHNYSRSSACLGMGHLCLWKGDLKEATRVLERGLEIVRIGNFRVQHTWIASNLGYAYVLSGRIPEGLPLLEQAVEQTASIGLMSFYSLWVTQLGGAHLLAGRMDDATRFASRALDLSREHTERPYEAWALRLLGEIHSHPDALDAEKAEENYRAALVLASELGMRPLIAHCRKGLGSLYGRTGREEVGRSVLTAAIDMYREMGMTFWLEQAEEALVGVG